MHFEFNIHDSLMFLFVVVVISMSRHVLVIELITANGGKSRISAPLQSMLTRHTEPHTSALTPQKYHYPVTTYWGLKSTTTTPQPAGPDPIFKIPHSPKVPSVLKGKEVMGSGDVEFAKIEV